MYKTVEATRSTYCTVNSRRSTMLVMPSQSRAQSRSLSRESRGKSRLIAERFPWIRQETRRRYQSIVQRTRTWQESLFKSNNAPFFPPLPLARAPRRIKGKRGKTCPEEPSNRSIVHQAAANDGRRGPVRRMRQRCNKISSLYDDAVQRTKAYTMPFNEPHRVKKYFITVRGWARLSLIIARLIDAPQL